jgi:hypothetical protein
LLGYREVGAHGTYGLFDCAELPPIERALDNDLAWLLGEPIAGDWAIVGGAERDADRRAWSKMAGFSDIVLPSSFEAFVASSEPACRIRSATGCYVERADFVVSVVGGGQLVHFLSDQQWIRHWLVYIDDGGAESVVSTYPPYGFAEEREPDEFDPGYTPESLRSFDPGSADAIVCADSFSEFLYRFWIENEIFFRQKEGGLTPEQQRYLDHYTRLGG